MLDSYDILNKYLGIDVKKFMLDFSDFCDEREGAIYSYYSGDSNSVNSEYLAELDSLNDRCIKIIESISLNKIRFQNTSYWNITNTIDDIKIKLDTVLNMAKWCRSSRTPLGFNTLELNYVQMQNESLERLASRSGFIDPENDWVDIALKNSLSEENYSKEGGVLLKVVLQNDNKISLQTVVDTLSGEKVHGLDIYKKISFEDNDLLCLGHKDTINQSASVLVGLVKGSVPEFENDGVDKALLGIMNKAMNVYPSVMRQLTNTFKNDDTFSEISIVDIRREQDSLHIEISIITRLGTMIKENLMI